MFDSGITSRMFPGSAVLRPMMTPVLLLAATALVGCSNSGPVDASGGQAEAKADLDAWKAAPQAKAGAGPRGQSLGDVMLHPKGRKGGAGPQ
jgi:hypothetical protein